MKSRKSFIEKLHDNKDLPRVEVITGKMNQRWGTGTFVIPAPIEVDELMKKVRKGKVVTINDIRAKLAEKHGATIACPITTGIFASIAARAAEEELLQGKKRITPYWRTLKLGGELNPKYPGGVKQAKKVLEAEGHKIVKKGNRYFVLNYEKRLQKF